MSAACDGQSRCMHSNMTVSAYLDPFKVGYCHTTCAMYTHTFVTAVKPQRPASFWALLGQLNCHLPTRTSISLYWLGRQQGSA